MNNFGKLCRIFLFVGAEKVDRVRLFCLPLLYYEIWWPTRMSLGDRGKKWNRWLMLNSGGSKASTHTKTHVGTLSHNAIHMLTLPHAHTLEAITYANTSSHVFDKDKQSQVSVLHTQLPSSKQKDAATPASGYLITLLKKFQCNHLQKLQRQGQ